MGMLPILIGGAEADTSNAPLSGENERIWCGSGSNNPTTSSVTLGDNCIAIQVNTENYGEGTGFKLSTKPEDGSTPTTLLEFPAGSLKSESEYKKQVCVAEGAYTLTVVGKARHSAYIAGEEVLFGRNYLGKTTSHTVLAGFKPSMSDRETEWLKEHNTRREVFHKKHTKDYRPLQWSPELAKDASDWVDEMLPTCKVIREANVDEGENISVKKYTGPRGNDEGPANILNRWSDLKVNYDYPDNQTMTQVMWRSTRHVGCADKFVKNDDGSYCYVSVCRYSRPGNCSVRSYANWLTATLEDHTWCGQTCPEEGCH